MSKASLLVVAALGASLSSQARTLDPQEAWDIATMHSVSTMRKAPAHVLTHVYANTDSALNIPTAPANTFTHVYTLTDSALNIPTVYVYAPRSGAGFVMASASDQAVPLLGYSDKATFDPADINPEMGYWLNCYSAQVAEAETNPDVKMVVARADESRSDIAPLITATWDQGDPYNQDCPLVFGRRSVTGCIATAFAQIMRYHQWPQDYATGSNEYSWRVRNEYDLTEEYTESMDFSTIKFDWENMPDALSPYSPEAHRNAVAKLIHACGVMSNATYTSGETSANDYNAMRGLITNMGYDKAATVRERNQYDLDGWADLLYSELAEKRPMVYSGQSDSNTLIAKGHAFICDGYESSTGYFHFNWGWSGRANGYYALTQLTPYYSGIGGGGEGAGYNYGQSVCTGIKPATADSEYAVMLIQDEDLTAANDINSKGEWIDLSGRFINKGLTEIQFFFGLKLVDAYNPESVTYINLAPSPSIYSIGTNYYYQKISVHGSMIPTGKYYASVVYRFITDEDWKELQYAFDVRRTILLEANNEYVAFNGTPLPSDDDIQPLKLINAHIVADKEEFDISNEIVSITGVFYNQSGFRTMEGLCGLKFEEIHNPANVYYAPGTHNYTNRIFKLRAGYYQDSWYGNPSNVPEGKYIVTPVFQLKGSDEWIDFEYDDQYVHFLTCEIIGNLVKFYEINGISDVLNDVDSTDVHYFDLMGHEVDTPASGIYIRVSGGKAQKIYLK